MKQYLVLFLLISFSYSQNAKVPNNDIDRQLFEERISNIQKETNQLKEDSKQIETDLKKEISDQNIQLNKNIDTYKSDTKDRIDLYVLFISISAAIIGFAIQFFGKRAIKKRVEELIIATAQTHIEKKIVETLNSKITNDLIENAIKNRSEDEINKIIASIEDKGNTAIDQIKTKGDEAIKSMLASPPKAQVRLTKKHLSDQDIIKRNDSLRADEFFNLAFNSKDPRIQIELYKNVVEIEPNNFHALNNMAVSHNNLNETKEAIELLNKAIKINPDYYQAYTNRAQAYNLQNNFEQALNDVSTAIEMESKFEYAYAVKGNILTKQGKFPEAELTLNTAIEINPNSAEAYYNRAFFYEERTEYLKSIQDYEKAESLGFMNKAMLYNNMAVLYRRIKQFDKAIGFIEKAKVFNPNFPNIDGTLALIYADKNDDESFYTHLKTALEKGCQAWNYLLDPGFDKYRDSPRLRMLIEPYKKKYYS